MRTCSSRVANQRDFLNISERKLKMTKKVSSKVVTMKMLRIICKVKKTRVQSQSSKKAKKRRRRSDQAL